MPPAARVSDQTAHGTPLAPGPGSPDVLIGGQPAWRAATDTHACPLWTGMVPHSGGVVTVGSSTVLINGVPAARLGDTIAEAGPPNTIVSGDPTVIIGGGATSAQPPWAASLYTRLSTYVERYNENVDETDLGLAGEQLQNERINLHVTADEGEAIFSFRTDQHNRIHEFERGPRDDATLRVETDKETIDRITASDTPVQEFQTAVMNDQITITGIGTVNEVKWVVLNHLKDAAEFVRTR